jgi:UDP-N-acetylglucosamine--N-acetylmuramyl-(pentapeptide) pyrophosphoryl-undecaprenol N-acetylglucosamine transferase
VNARNLVDKNAALMVKDSEALHKVVPAIIELANDNNKQNELKRNIGMLAITDADKIIAEEVLKLI